MNIRKEIEMHEHVVRSFKMTCIDALEKCKDFVLNVLKQEIKFYFAEMAGAQRDSQHIVAEFVGRFMKERKGLPAIALTTDTSILTAIGNDYGYEDVFRRQVEALGKAGDLIIGISTSGNSKNIIKAFYEAKEKGMKIIAFTGQKTQCR